MVIQEKSIKDALEHIKAHVENASQESTNFESARTILNEMVRLE